MRLIFALLVLGSLAACTAAKGYTDSKGKQHDHDVAMPATICYCGVTCDRATVCCGVSHCVCRPN